MTENEVNNIHVKQADVDPNIIMNDIYINMNKEQVIWVFLMIILLLSLRKTNYKMSILKKIIFITLFIA